MQRQNDIDGVFVGTKAYRIWQLLHGNGYVKREWLMEALRTKDTNSFGATIGRARKELREAGYEISHYQEKVGYRIYRRQSENEVRPSKTGVLINSTDSDCTSRSGDGKRQG